MCSIDVLYSDCSFLFPHCPNACKALLFRCGNGRKEKKVTRERAGERYMDTGGGGGEGGEE